MRSLGAGGLRQHFQARNPFFGISHVVAAQCFKGTLHQRLSKAFRSLGQKSVELVHKSPAVNQAPGEEAELLVAVRPGRHLLRQFYRVISVLMAGTAEQVVPQCLHRERVRLLLEPFPHRRALTS